MFSHPIDKVQQRLRGVQPHQPDAMLARVVEDLGILIEVEAPGLVPLRLHFQDLQVAVVENVPVERSLQTNTTRRYGQRKGVRSKEKGRLGRRTKQQQQWGRALSSRVARA